MQGFLCSIAEGIRNFVGPRGEHLKASLASSEDIIHEVCPQNVHCKFVHIFINADAQSSASHCATGC
jgi:hypothetical protein